MKKSCVLMVLLINICCLFIFASCSTNNFVKSISFQNNNEIVTIEIGKFNYDDYKITANYSDGNKEEITLTEEMISAYDKLKFYKVGEQTIKITYKNCNCEIKINVQRANLDNLVFESKTVVYTGKPFTMEVQGNIPADVKVRYPNGNSFSNSGTYDITAICYGDNYETKELFATLRIEKAKYDMSNVKFENATFNYDRTPKSISITGTLPDGVSVEYRIGEKKGNSETNAGQYEVIVSFSSKNTNYEQIPEKTATLTINKAKYGNIDLKLADKKTTYSGHSNYIEADLTAVPKGVNSYYTIQKVKNAKGEDVESSVEEGNSATLAGTYIVRVNFIVTDTENYESIAPKSAILIIERAIYEIDNAFMYSQSFVYDGKEKSINLSGEGIETQPVLPFGVSVTYTNKQIRDKNGNEVEGIINVGNSLINAGTYEITAHLTSTDENYKEISDITGILEIRQAEYEDLKLNMYDMTVKYDGNSHSIIVNYTTLPETITIHYTIKMTKTGDGSVIENPIESIGNSATEIGTYEICATFVNSNENYEEISSITAILVITEVE